MPSVGAAHMRSNFINQLHQRWAPSQTRRAVVLAAASPPPMRSFDTPASSSNGRIPNSSSTSATSSAAAPVAPGDPSYRSYRVSPWAAMKFNGPVPERVNGRLAMLAFLYIAQHEAETGQTGVSVLRLHLAGAKLSPCGGRRRCGRYCSALPTDRVLPLPQSFPVPPLKHSPCQPSPPSWPCRLQCSSRPWVCRTTTAPGRWWC